MYEVSDKIVATGNVEKGGNALKQRGGILGSINIHAATGGAATVTDACVFDFNAAVGSHKAIDSGSAHPDIDTTDAWMKIDINGTIHYIPCYTDKS